MGFLTKYQAVFTAIKAILEYVPAVPMVPAVPAHDGIPEVPAVPAVPASGVASLKTVILGEQFTLGDLPKAIINPEEAPINQATQGCTLGVKINFSVILVIRDYTPSDWFVDIIPVMADVVDAILADRSLGGTVMDVTPTGFYPGEIHFKEQEKDRLLYGGQVSFTADLLYTP
jgi:hypothetical protein